MKYVIEMIGQGSGVTFYFDRLGKWDWLNKNTWKKRNLISALHYNGDLEKTTIFKGKFNADLICNYLNQYFVDNKSLPSYPGFICGVIEV